MSCVSLALWNFRNGGECVPPVPGCWDGRNGGELLASALVQDGVGIGLYVAFPSLSGPRGGPDECATIVRVNGGALGAGAGCRFTPEILVDGIRSCCDSIPLAALSDRSFFNGRCRGGQN